MLLDYAKFAAAMAQPTYELVRTLYQVFKGDPVKATEEIQRYIHITNHGKQLDEVQRVNDLRVDAARVRAASRKKP